VKPYWRAAVWMAVRGGVTVIVLLVAAGIIINAVSALTKHRAPCAITGFAPGPAGAPHYIYGPAGCRR
jgi:hypothetical protein